MKNYILSMIKFLSENPRLISFFSSWIKRQKNVTNQYGYTSYGTWSTEFSMYENKLKEFKKIIFYEWSNLDGSKKYFNNLNDFFKFMKECKIPIPPYAIKSDLEKWNTIYAVCMPNSTDILASDTKNGLKEKLNKYIV